MSTALVIDDSRAMRLLVGSTLASFGFQVLEAGNGAEALRVIEEEPLRLSLLTVDWNMPVLNGLQFVRQIRSDVRFRHIPIVMITSECQPAQIEEALETGVDEYIMKPFNQDGLREKFALLGIGQ